MEYLDLQLLKKCCRPDSKGMDELETSVVHEILVQNLILDLDVSTITQCLYTAEYINEDVYRNAKRHFDRLTLENHLKINKRVLVYIKSKVTFVALLWSLAKCGYQSFANLLLLALERKRCSAISSHVQKTPVKRCTALHVLVKQLKTISDSKVVENPVAFIRRISMRYKERFTEENDTLNKRKVADRYFAVLAVEVDNFSFMTNTFVSVKSLVAEIRRIIPFTTNPAMNEALLNGRVAEVTASTGRVQDAVSIIQDVMTVVLSTETCPESGNLFYSYLNVLLHNYEYCPTGDKKDHYIEIGYNGLRLIRVLEEDMCANWKVYFMFRMMFCALGISISGRPIFFKPNNVDFDTVQYFLGELQSIIGGYGDRRKMMFHLAMGRMLHLKGEFQEAMYHLKQSRELAIKGAFVESKNIVEYMNNISERERIY